MCEDAEQLSSECGEPEATYVTRRKRDRSTRLVPAASKGGHEELLVAQVFPVQC